MNETKTVDVVFLMTPKREEGDYQEVIAFFPKVMWNAEHNACYCHNGQHGPCCEQFARECRAATEDEYKPLLNELKEIGYEPTVKDANDWLNERKVA